jgi:hypothetical protein
MLCAALPSGDTSPAAMPRARSATRGKGALSPSPGRLVLSASSPGVPRSCPAPALHFLVIGRAARATHIKRPCWPLERTPMSSVTTLFPRATPVGYWRRRPSASDNRIVQNIVRDTAHLPDPVPCERTPEEQPHGCYRSPHPSTIAADT